MLLMRLAALLLSILASASDASKEVGTGSLVLGRECDGAAIIITP